MKVVINNCYGGFDLSAIALDQYYKRKGIKVYFYTKLYKKPKYLYFKKIKPEEINKNQLFIIVNKDLGKNPKEISYKSYVYYGNLERNDQDLIYVIEKLKEKANTEYSSLKVIEIPDNTKWSIIDYNDGVEEIEEDHQSWS